MVLRVSGLVKKHGNWERSSFESNELLKELRYSRVQNFELNRLNYWSLSFVNYNYYYLYLTAYREGNFLINNFFEQSGYQDISHLNNKH